ncbi:MAG: histidine kinase dimerization/phospho-acceptor domain-containing protein, partial [Candidatus Saccharimonadales bacterium]
MKTHSILRTIKTPTTRLAMTYLTIIMLMSVSFSIVFYNTSSRQLGRQLPPDSFFHQLQTGQPAGRGTNNTMSNGDDTHTFIAGGSRDEVSRYLQARIDEGRSDLFRHLVYLNISALLLGALISYALARRALEPIEETMEAQAQFVSDASHELRTPLTAIQTSNEVFMRRPKATLHEAKSLINQNTEDVKRLKQLSDALLNLAQHDNHH